MFTKAIFAVVLAVVASVHAAPSADACTGVIYTVVSGDNCFALGQRFGTTAQEIIDANPGVNADCTNLIPGQALCIPI